MEKNYDFYDRARIGEISYILGAKYSKMQCKVFDLIHDINAFDVGGYYGDSIELEEFHSIVETIFDYWCNSSEEEIGISEYGYIGVFMDNEKALELILEKILADKKGNK